MSGIRVMTAESMGEFVERFEQGMDGFIPMLPFVKNQYHDWDQYRRFSDEALFLVDDLDGDHCLYGLKKLGDALAIRLVMPSDWDRRAGIAMRSMDNLVRWFRREAGAAELLVQVAEYAEFIAFPTLSHHLIPAIIEAGFACRYMMYMRRDHYLPIPGDIHLPDGFEQVDYDDAMLEEIVAFYSGNFPGYFVNCTTEELRALARPGSAEYELFSQTAVFLRDRAGAIAAGVFATPNHETVVYPGAFWLDNFAVRPDCAGEGLGTFLLCEEIKRLARLYPGKDGHAYVRRDRRDAVKDYEALNFVPFEFWIDAKLTK